MISSPGWAGRQCSANASGPALSSSASSIDVGRERLAAGGGGVLVVAHRDPDVGVDGVGAGDGLGRVLEQDRRASRPPAAGSRRGRRRAPRHPPAHRRRPASARRCCRRRRRSARGRRASRAPRASSADRRAPGTGGAAARACSRREQWHARRSPSSSSSSPVRSPITAAWRERTSAVSRTDSPRVSCISSARRTIGCPPSSKTPDSNDVRVRVDGLLNRSATVRPSSAREESGASLSAAARWSSEIEPVRVQLGAGDEVCGVRALTWNLYHGRSPEPAGTLAAQRVRGALAGWEWDVALLQEVPPWWPPLLAAAAGAQRAPRADLAQLRAPAAPGDLRAQPGHPQVQRRRRQRDPRARRRSTSTGRSD